MHRSDTLLLYVCSGVCHIAVGLFGSNSTVIADYFYPLLNLRRFFVAMYRCECVSRSVVGLSAATLLAKSPVYWFRRLICLCLFQLTFVLISCLR